MKRLILLLLAGLLVTAPALGEDDDSTPYMPFPEQKPQTQSTPAPKKAAPKKRTNTKKKTTPKKAATKKATTKPKPPARPSSLQQGIELMQQERYEQAKPYLLKAIQEDRHNPNVWYWYGVYHEKTGGFYQAQYFYSKAITIDPAFEPLSRVVYYPEDSEKTPLWDPKRPARVYPIEVAAVPQNRSSFPTAPNDPELPRVPVYTPPEPGSSPLDGDAWSPAVYVPPSPEEVDTEGEISPVYLPPQPASVVAQERSTLEVPMYAEGYEVQRRPLNYDDTVRADKPLYNPPRPGEKPQVIPKQSAQPQQQVIKPQPKQQASSSQRKAAVPDTRIVRTNTKKAKTKPAPAPAPAQTRTQPQRQRSRTTSRDVRPQTPAPAPARAPEPVTLPPEPETRPVPQQQYLPPVGQYAPDPGTISETPIPPVGQGNNY